ncbi:MAG: hypothetical protein DDT20_01899 [Firmicutes bacterium]|nr:hypothetical protein [Bacillota bacterium]
MKVSNMQNRATLRDLFRFFFMLGVTAFGGPVAHLAIMQREAVEKREMTMLTGIGVTAQGR